MKKTTIFAFLLMFIIAACGTCKKDAGPVPDNPYGLPNATQNGSNIFACLINGQNYIAYNDFTHLGATIINDTLSVGGGPKNTYFHSMLFQLKSDLQEGNTYRIGSSDLSVKYVTDSICTGGVFTIFEFKAISGSVQITRLNKTAKIVSGIFDFIVPSPNCDTLKFTNGRFDINYR